MEKTSEDLRSLRAWEASHGISRHLLAEAVRSGEIRAYRLGLRTILIRRFDLERWLERHRVDGARPPEPPEGA